MSRIARTRRLQSLQLPLSSPAPRACRANFAAAALAASASRSISTTSSVGSSKNTEWVRSKLWKGKPPGPEDPYTQRMEEEEVSYLPEEAERMAREPAVGRSAKRHNSRLSLPPERSEAIVESEVQSKVVSYVPATDISELEEIPTPENWWEQPGNWGEESQFKGFGRSGDKIMERELLEVYLRRAVVEVLALKETGKFSEWVAKRWTQGTRENLDQALAVGVEARDGQVSLSGNAAEVVNSLTAEVEDVADITAELSLEEAAEMMKAWDPSWKTIAVDDEIKFALRKRLYQLTGILISDAKLGAARTVNHLLTQAARPLKPEKLADAIAAQTNLHELSNVTVHDRKIGMIAKETAVGRWKVIEAELQKRGLPATGSGDLPRNREKDWLRGKA